MHYFALAVHLEVRLIIKSGWGFALACVCCKYDLKSPLSKNVSTFFWNQNIVEHLLNVDIAIYATRLYQVTKTSIDFGKALVVAAYTRLFDVNKNIKLFVKLV